MASRIAQQELKTAWKNPRRFFCVDDSDEKGFFYSVNVELRGGPLAARPA